jgi:hypothetical protein
MNRPMLCGSAFKNRACRRARRGDRSCRRPTSAGQGELENSKEGARKPSDDEPFPRVQIMTDPYVGLIFFRACWA